MKQYGTQEHPIQYLLTNVDISLLRIVRLNKHRLIMVAMFASDSAHSPASRLYTPSPTCWRPPADPHQTASSPSASYLQGPAPSPGSGPLWDTQWHVEIFLQIREIHDKPFYPVRNNAYAKCVIVFSIYILQMLNMYHGCFVWFFLLVSRNNFIDTVINVWVAMVAASKWKKEQFPGNPI